MSSQAFYAAQTATVCTTLIISLIHMYQKSHYLKLTQSICICADICVYNNNRMLLGQRLNSSKVIAWTTLLTKCRSPENRNSQGSELSWKLLPYS